MSDEFQDSYFDDMPPLSGGVGGIVRHYLDVAKCSQIDFARIIGMSEVGLSNILNSNSIPRRKTIVKLAGGLRSLGFENVTDNYLLAVHDEGRSRIMVGSTEADLDLLFQIALGLPHDDQLIIKHTLSALLNALEINRRNNPRD